jgi:8-hydroxy-5-deazaflavin:NADPH oxidoreductase
MTIGIVGTGNVGATLGRRFAQLGHTVAFGTRRPESAGMAELAHLPHSRVVSQKEAAQSSEIIVLATPWPAAREAIQGLGSLNGKILFDCTNPLLPSLDGLEVGKDCSAGEMVAQWASGAQVVKIFNTIGYNVMENPDFKGEPATLFYCGNDPAAKNTARTLAAALGFDPVDAGPLRQARLLEPLALLWISLAFSGQGTGIAFRLLHRAG